MNRTEFCRHLPWDSAFFGRRIASLDALNPTIEALHEALSWCRAESVECLYWLADSDAIRFAEAHDFGLMDVRVTLNRRLELANAEKSADSAAPFAVRPATPDDIAPLRAIAKISHHDSRFYADPNFPTELCDALYQTWIERSLQGYADVVFVAERSGQVAGYISCRRESGAANSGQIGLLAVAPQAQGHGIGAQLIGQALSWCAESGTKKVSVVTQGRNCAAQRLYQRCGFVTESVHLWYHRWFLSEEPLP